MRQEGVGRPSLSGYNPGEGRPHLPNTLARPLWLAAGRSREARGGGAPLLFVSIPRSRYHKP
ncbi:MAG: hypothetical protein AVDCRST_MAG25-2709 [uncultured Rubrobacteraceae bacterium]|uniref:Uncharacterized protein n=1 Tax=uncultured Rubrobacteraceae bacterium TaxID=349277 RepID=A0A6J4RYA1_9ACTN|nr:MAG: hypothetical protein AVDCRST_MAG25-2709 [uncultured Rubrobacteraceae bacterium]